MKLTGALPPGATATDLVLTVTQILRKHGVVNKFVEFYGDGVSTMSLADRATIANMAPEYGATMGFFPIDAETLRYLAPHGPHEGRGRAGRALRQGAGPVPHRHDAGADVHLDAGARPVDGRAVPRRAEAAAGSHSAGRDEGGVAARLAGGVSQAVARSAGARPLGRGGRSAGRAGRGQAGAGGGGRRSGLRRRRGAARRQAVPGQPRQRGDRGDHQLHEHEQPVGDGRRGAAWRRRPSRRASRFRRT